MSSYINAKNGSFSYICSQDLEAAVQVAIRHHLPLLVTGEPGTGKTELAYYVAQKYGLESPLRFNTKTTSKASDLFYRYNALAHFRDSQTGKPDVNPMNYVYFEALGKAIIEAGKRRHVILIDEIDKAPRDFPNDVLFEFEQMAFRVEEAAIEEVKRWAKTQELERIVDDEGVVRYAGTEEARPIVILTSNSEKNLPDAFLRRCAYYHIEFPKKELLLEITQKKVPFNEHFTRQMLEDAIDHFLEIRDYGMRKDPATAELIVWIHELKAHGIDVKKGLQGSNREIRDRLRHSYNLLTKNKEDRDRVIAEMDRS